MAQYGLETPRVGRRKAIAAVEILVLVEAGARFDFEASQFEVLDHRPIETILGESLAAGATIDCYEPPGHA